MSFVPLPRQESGPIIARYGLPVRGYPLFVGNVEPRKNLLALVKAYDRLRRDTPLAPRLAIVGGAGWKNGRIHQAAVASPFAVDVRFLGYVPDRDVPALMNGAIALVYPSLYEGFGLPPLEAMACETPVITSSRSSLPEVVGNAALLVDPEDRAALVDAMARIANEEALREDLRERWPRQARRFSLEETARRRSACTKVARSRITTAMARAGIASGPRRLPPPSRPTDPPGGAGMPLRGPGPDHGPERGRPGPAIGFGPGGGS